MCLTLDIKLYYCTIFRLCLITVPYGGALDCTKVDRLFLQSPGKSNNIPVASIKKLLLLN